MSLSLLHRRRDLHALPFLCAALLGSTTGAQPLLAQSLPQRVVLFYDERTDLPGLSKLDAGLTRVLNADASGVEIYREAMDLSRFDSEAYRTRLRDYLEAKYAGREIGVTVAVLGPALDFLLEHGSQIFPGARIVFCGIDRRELNGRALPPQVTGVVLKREFAPTLELAVRLQPGIRNVVVVSGTSAFDVRLLQQARVELAPFEGKLSFRYLSDLPMHDLLNEVARLPRETVVLYTSLFRDGAGQAFVPHSAAAAIAEAASVPVYGFVDQYLGRGLVGGHMYSLDRHGELAARLALLVLKGADPAGLPVLEPSTGTVRVDAGVMDRWGIRTHRLPANAIVDFRPPSLWREYRMYVAIALVMLVVQAAMISTLLLQRARRRHMEAQLRESEARFRTMADTAAVMLWIADEEGQLTFCNRAWLDFAGTTLDEQLGLRWTTILHPDDRHRCMGVYQQSFERRKDFTFECRFRSRGGSYRWLLCRGVPCYADDGTFQGYLGSCVDITLRYEAELEHRHHIAEVAHLNRLATTGALTASIAHELSQPLSAIMFNASAAAMILDKTPASPERIRPILADIRQDDQRAVDIIRKMRNLLHRHELTRQPLAVNPMIEETVQLMSVEAATRHIALAFEPSPANPLVAGDRVHLQQVVINLVLNALEAVALSPVDQRRVGVRAETSVDGSVTVAVCDSGPGVPADAIQHIFEPFHTTRPNGLGLGLSICRTIVEAHDGRIWVESTDRGASFYVTIPLLAQKHGLTIPAAAILTKPALDSSVVSV